MLPAEILKKVRRIEIRTNRLVNESLAGEYHSVFKGRGMEFSEVREYQFGDDIRTIDWNVTSRMGHPYVKKYVEERELTVILLVDFSASGQFGTRRQFKREIEAEICALLAFSAIKNNDRVGLIAFTDRIEKFLVDTAEKAKQQVTPSGKPNDVDFDVRHQTRVPPPHFVVHAGVKRLGGARNLVDVEECNEHPDLGRGSRRVRTAQQVLRRGLRRAGDTGDNEPEQNRPIPDHALFLSPFVDSMSGKLGRSWASPEVPKYRHSHRSPPPRKWVQGPVTLWADPRSSCRLLLVPLKIKRDGWRKRGILVVDFDRVDDLSWSDRELLCGIGDRLYGHRKADE